MVSRNVISQEAFFWKEAAWGEPEQIGIDDSADGSDSVAQMRSIPSMLG